MNSGRGYLHPGNPPSITISTEGVVTPSLTIVRLLCRRWGQEDADGTTGSTEDRESTALGREAEQRPAWVHTESSLERGFVQGGSRWLRGTVRPELYEGIQLVGSVCSRRAMDVAQQFLVTQLYR